MDAIYHRTHLGDSLLQTLEALCQRGELEPAEARRILGDFDEIMDEELRSSANFGSRKTKLTGKVTSYQFANMPRNKRDPRWTGQGGATWVMTLANAAFEIGGKVQRLDGVTQVLTRHPVGRSEGQSEKHPGRKPGIGALPSVPTDGAKSVTAEKRSVISEGTRGAKESAGDGKRTAKAQPKPGGKKATRSFWAAGRGRGKAQEAEREKASIEVLRKREAGKRRRFGDGEMGDGVGGDGDCAEEDGASDEGEPDDDMEDMDDLLGYLDTDVNESDAVGRDSGDGGGLGGIGTRADGGEGHGDDDTEGRSSGDDGEGSIEARMDEFADLLDEDDRETMTKMNQAGECSSAPEPHSDGDEHSRRELGDNRVLDAVDPADASSGSTEAARATIRSPPRPGLESESVHPGAAPGSDLASSSGSDSDSVADEDLDNMLSAFGFGTGSQGSAENPVREDRGNSRCRGDGSEASPGILGNRAAVSNGVGSSISGEATSESGVLGEDAEPAIKDSDSASGKVNVPTSSGGPGSGSDDDEGDGDGDEDGNDGDDGSESDEDIRDMEAFLQKTTAALLE